MTDFQAKGSPLKEDAAEAVWRASRSVFTKVPIPGLRPGMFVRAVNTSRGEPYEVLKVVGDQFVACRLVCARGQRNLKSYVLTNDANFFRIVEPPDSAAASGGTASDELVASEGRRSA